jgi:uncharacterized YccA/Bax inhibitor family protein
MSTGSLDITFDVSNGTTAIGSAPTVPSVISMVSAAFNGLNISIKSGSGISILVSLFIIYILLLSPVLAPGIAAYHFLVRVKYKN